MLADQVKIKYLCLQSFLALFGQLPLCVVGGVGLSGGDVFLFDEGQHQQYQYQSVRVCNKMNAIEKQLIESLHSSAQHIISMFDLIKGEPPALEANSILTYAQAIQNLLKQLKTVIPKLCVPKGLFKQYQQQNFLLKDTIKDMQEVNKKTRIDMKVIQERLHQTQDRERSLLQERMILAKNNHMYRKKVQSLKRSGEESVRNVIEVVSQQKSRQPPRRSLPTLDKKEKLGLLWLIGNNNESTRKLAQHLYDKQ